MEPPTTSQRIRKNGELIARTERVRHLSAEIQSHIRTNFLHGPEATRKALSMTFVSLQQIQMTKEETRVAVRNPSSAMMSHFEMVALLTRHVEHMHSTGEVQKLQSTRSSATLKDLLLETEKALRSLNLDIEIYASIKENEASSAAIRLSDTFLIGGNSLYNETLRAFGVANDIEQAMDCLYTFYKANEKALSEEAS